MRMEPGAKRFGAHRPYAGTFSRQSRARLELSNAPDRLTRVFQLATPGRKDTAMSSNLIEITGAEALADDGGPSTR